MLKAIDCANWLIEQASNDINGGEYLTQLKVQKLLYFAQGINLVLYGKPLFKDKIYHEKYGPVVKSIITYLKPFGYKSIDTLGMKDKLKDLDKEKDALNSLNLAYQNFGIYSASKLVDLTHKDKCWLETKDGEEIKPDDIKKTFKESYFC